jgi:hypothetical protein
LDRVDCEQQLVSETERFFLVLRRQADRNVIPQRTATGLLGQAPALECAVLEAAARRYELRAINFVGARVELATVAGSFAPQHRKAFGVAVVEDLHDFGALVGKPKVPFVDDECAAKRI